MPVRIQDADSQDYAGARYAEPQQCFRPVLRRQQQDGAVEKVNHEFDSDHGDDQGQPYQQSAMMYFRKAVIVLLRFSNPARGAG